MYDLAVIGAGWAGFNAALKAKQYGRRVCLIDAGSLGGTCLNRGCVPTKALISSAKSYSLIKKAAAFGVEIDNPRINFSLMQEKKEKVVALLNQGMLSRLSGIEFINSLARLKGPGQIEVSGRIIESKYILLATGSFPRELPQLKFGEKNIISSDQALQFKEVPETFLIVGGGFIGCEFASLFSTLGSQVTLIEKTPSLLPGEDREISRKIEGVFRKKGIKVITSSDISALEISNYSRVLVSVGRRPNTSGLGLVEAGVKLNNDSVMVDPYLQTNLANVYASGDCCADIMLAHFAAYQGVTAVENMFGSRRKADNLVVPSCIFTDPQIASVGIKESQTPDPAVKVHKFDFRASAMAQIYQETDGWVKIITDEQSGCITGASVVGPQATELIATLTLAVHAKFTVEKFREVIFAHPTFSESLADALK